jgi:hypothetical protein
MSLTSSLITKTVLKKIAAGVCIIAVLWVGATAALYRVMRQPPEAFGRFMMHVPGPVAFLIFPFETLWLRARAGDLQVGDRAPDFRLTKLDKSGQVQLSLFTAQSKPVVLIFGSYT